MPKLMNPTNAVFFLIYITTNLFDNFFGNTFLQPGKFSKLPNDEEKAYMVHFQPMHYLDL